jgi:HK97 family phage major capsid protein
MEFTLQHIAEAVGDIKKNMATVPEVMRLIDEKLKQDEEKSKALIAGELKEVKTAVQELNTAAKNMAAEIKAVQRNRFAAIKSPDGLYKGFWPSLESCRDFGLFVIAHVLGDTKAKEELEAKGINCKYVDKDGKFSNEKATGFDPAIPEDFVAFLVERIGMYGVYRRNALVWPISGGSSSFPILNQDPEVYCLEAGVAPSASSIGFGAGGLSPKNWISYIPVPRSTMESAAIAIGEVVGRRLARAFGRKEDSCGFMGDGTSTYFNHIGLTQALLRVDTSAPSTNTRALFKQTTAGTWAAIVKDDILGLQGIIHDDADDGVDLKWYCNKNFYYTVLLKLALGLGGVSAQEVINTAYGRNPYFLGRPVEFVPPMDRIKPAADHVPLLYGNLRMAAIMGEARAYSLASDSSVFFTSDSVAIRATERIGMNNETGVGTKSDATVPEDGVVVGLYADIA